MARKLSLRVLLVLLSAPMVFLLVECVRGAWCDLQLIRTTALRTEIGQLRLQAMRRAGHLETLLQMQGDGGDWRQLPAIEDFWKPVEGRTSHQVYAAVVDSLGLIVLHNDPAMVGKELGRRWYEEAVPAAGSDVVRVQNGMLSGERPAYDIRLPLMVGNRVVGDYHEGLDAAWFDQAVAALQREVLQKWAVVLLLAIVISAGGAAALVAVARWQRALEGQVENVNRVRKAQLGQVASGLAHEIRNPLHALRINLHALRRSFSGRTQLPPEDLATTIDQSDNAIGTMEELLRDLLRFATPTDGQGVPVNLVAETQATMNLLGEEMRRSKIDLQSHFVHPEVTVSIDPARLRQVLVNLLTFAQHNAGTNGKIEVDILEDAHQAVVIVADNGPAMTTAQQVRVFEPFQAHRQTGSGLGLALVKSFVEEAGGSVGCEPGNAAGCRFRVQLPIFTSRRKG